MIIGFSISSVLDLLQFPMIGSAHDLYVWVLGSTLKVLERRYASAAKNVTNLVTPNIKDDSKNLRDVNESYLDIFVIMQPGYRIASARSSSINICILQESFEPSYSKAVKRMPVVQVPGKLDAVFVTIIAHVW
jgi:hypothetical protein